MENTNLLVKPEQEAVIINERIRANGQAAVNAVCAIGRDLRRMKIEGLYTHLGYDSFEEYAEQEHNLKRRQAYQYISVYENLGEDFVQSNAQLGITKLALLTQVNTEDRAEIMEDNDLSDMTVNEIKALLEKVKVQGEQLSLLEDENKTLTEEKSELEKCKDFSAEIDEMRRKKEEAERHFASLEERIKKNDEMIAGYAKHNDRLLHENEKRGSVISSLQAQKYELEKKVKELENRPIDVAVAEPEIKEVVKEVIKEVPDKKAIAEKDREIVTLQNKYKALDEARIEEVEKLKKSYEERIAQLQNPPEKPADSEKSSFKLLYAEAYKSCLGLIEFIKSSEDKDKELLTERTDKLLDIVRESLHGENNDEN